MAVCPANQSGENLFHPLGDFNMQCCAACLGGWLWFVVSESRLGIRVGWTKEPLNVQ